MRVDEERWGTLIVAAVVGLLMVSLSLLLLCSREMMWNLDVVLMGTTRDIVFVGVKASAPPIGSE